MNERHICTAEDPWDESKSKTAEHPDAEDDGGDYGGLSGGGDYEKYKCPHCGLRFKVELPD